jgi:thioredoxin reductase
MNELYDVAIIGGGPAGLSAALVLGRSRRRVVVCDHGRPRNYAAVAVHGFLGMDGVAPGELRRRGVADCEKYGVEFSETKVLNATCDDSNGCTRFHLELENGNSIQARKLLIATGVRDEGRMMNQALPYKMPIRG